MLLHDAARLMGAPSGGVVVDLEGETAGVVGLPTAEVLGEALALLVPDADVLVVAESLTHVRSLLPDRNPRRAVIHGPLQVTAAAPDPTVEIGEVDDALLASLPPELAEEVDGARLVAVRRVAGQPVAACASWWPTETLWDVGIDTLESHRRQGHARACFRALASHLAGEGLRPVWGAYEDNPPSLEMAASLGFEPTDELWVFDVPST